MAITARQIITGALDLIGAKAVGEPIPAADAQDALRRMNNMMSGWNLLPLMSPLVAREVFALTANQSTYTIGPGGDFDTARPTALEGAGLLLNSSSPPIEIPRALMTDDAYEALQVKALTSALFTDVYFNATWADEWATVFLWPTPTTADNSLVLYRRSHVAGFADLSTGYLLPPGYADAIEYNLAIRLAVPYTRPVDPELKEQAGTFLGMVKRQNVKLTDLATDPALTHDSRYGYNIQTGTGA